MVPWSLFLLDVIWSTPKEPNPAWEQGKGWFSVVVLTEGECLDGGCLCLAHRVMGWNSGPLGVLCKSWDDCKATSTNAGSNSDFLCMRKAKEEWNKKVTFTKWFFPFPQKERCPHLRIRVLPRSFWQHFSILPRNTWACHSSSSLGVQVWPTPVAAPPSPSLIHRTCVSCEPLLFFYSGEYKKGLMHGHWPCRI